jgi:hypothetical protein
MEAAPGTREEVLRRVASVCSRLRILAAKALELENAESVPAFAAMLEALGQELAPYEETYEETLITQTYEYRGASRAQLYHEFWGAVENYELGGTNDLVGPVLELERSDIAQGDDV